MSKVGQEVSLRLECQTDFQGFGGRIQQLRLKKGISLRQLARTMEMSASYLSRIENNNCQPPSEKLMVKLADYFGQDKDVLLALGGRISSDILEIIRRHPKEWALTIRAHVEGINYLTF